MGIKSSKAHPVIAIARPDLAGEWHPTKNGTLTPENTALRSNKKIWWICPKGHEWQCTPDKRVNNGTNCTICSNRQLLVGYNDLRTTHPKLCSEWDDSKNEGLLPEQFTKISGTKVWWRCNICRHSWKTKISDRAKLNHGCPKCAILVRSEHERRTALEQSGPITDSVLLLDFDKEANYPFTPNDFSPLSNKYVFWKCHKCNYKWKAQISNRTLGRGCPCCANKAVVKGVNDLNTTHPELAKELNTELSGFGPDEVTAGSGKKAYWTCPHGHNYQATILHRSYGTRCPICFKGRQTSFAEQAVYYYVKQLYPDAISQFKADWLNRMELDVYIPSIKYAIEYDGIAWHKENKRESEQLKYHRCHEHGIKLIRLREESLSNTMGAGIADIQFGCPNLYESKNLELVIDRLLSSIYFKTFKNPLDIDINRDRFEIENIIYDLENESFESLFPELAKEWHPSKNGTIKPSMVKPFSSKKVWWICNTCQAEYEMLVQQKSKGRRCPNCVRIEKALKVIRMIDSESGEVIKTFSTIQEAEKETGVRQSNIWLVCAGRRKHAGGYMWDSIDNTDS